MSEKVLFSSSVRFDTVQKEDGTVELRVYSEGTAPLADGGMSLSAIFASIVVRDFNSGELSGRVSKLIADSVPPSKANPNGA